MVEMEIFCLMARTAEVEAEQVGNIRGFCQWKHLITGLAENEVDVCVGGEDVFFNLTGPNQLVQ